MPTGRHAKDVIPIRTSVREILRRPANPIAQPPENPDFRYRRRRTDMAAERPRRADDMMHTPEDIHSFGRDCQHVMPKQLLHAQKSARFKQPVLLVQ